jgi:ribosome biogenesis protein NSA2
MVHKRSEFAQKVHGIQAKLYNARRFKEEAKMRKTIAMHNEHTNKHENNMTIRLPMEQYLPIC